MLASASVRGDSTLAAARSAGALEGVHKVTQLHLALVGIGLGLAQLGIWQCRDNFRRHVRAAGDHQNPKIRQGRRPLSTKSADTISAATKGRLR